MKQTNTKKSSRSTGVAITSLLLFFCAVQMTEAAAGINKQINFQGKVVNTDGTNVASASYNFLFCIYTTASPATPCTAGANNDAVWRESKSLTVTDGIFQTGLGDTTVFPGSVDFNTDNIYLGINFNSNGQMTPLVRFTAAPYAMNADKIHGLTVTDTTGTLTIPNGKTIQFADAFTTAGAFPLTLTSTATTNATLPSGTITLADLATVQTLTNKTIGATGLVFSGAATDITTGTGESLVIVANGAGTVDIQDATTVDSLTADTGGVSIAANQAYTGAGAVTLSSTTNGLTLDSGSNTLTIAASDTAISATGVTALTLAANATITNATGNLTLQPAGSATTANVQIGAGGGTGSATPDLLALDTKNLTGDPTGFVGAMYYNVADAKFRCFEGAGWKNCDTTSAGGGTLQTAYDTASGNTILTTTGRNIALTLGEVAAPTSFTVENQDTAGVSAERIFNSIAGATTLTNGLLIEQTGTGTMTNALNILETAGTVATAINIGNNVGTGISIGTGVTTGISIASGGETITGGALAINNATGITSNQATLIIDASGTVDIRDIMNSDSVTTDTGGVSIAASQSYTGTGAVTLTSAAASGLTINSGTTGALAIGDDASAETITISTGGAVKTLTIGSTNTSSATTLQSGTGGINLKAEDTAEGNIQIGTGGAGTNTPDLLALDVKNNTGDPATAIEGTMYYNTADNVFRCYQNTAWTNCIGSGSGTPAGSTTQVQYNNAGAFGADAGLTFDSSTQTLALQGTNAEIVLNGITNEPSAPAAGDLDIYSKAVAGRMMLKWKAPSGVDTAIQPLLGTNTIWLWTPATGNTSVGTGFGNTWPSATGTVTHPTVTAGMGTQMKVMQLTNVATTTNQILGLTASSATLANVWRGNAAGQGGFFFQARFKTMLVPATTIRLFVGLTSLTTGVVAADTTTGDAAGFSHITTDNITTMAFLTRDNTTTTRATFTVPTLAAGNAYDATIYSPPNGSAIFYRLVDLLTGNVLVDTSTSTNLPRNTIFMGPQVQMSNGTANTTVTTTAIGINKIYLESDM